MKNPISPLLLALVLVPSIALSAAEKLSNHALLERIKQLESRLEGEAPSHDTGGHARNAVCSSWAERATFSGLVEVEGVYGDVGFAGAGSDESSDLVLATVELGIDAALSEYVGAHVLLLWEEDATEPIDVDEASILLDGGDDAPVWLRAGKTYVPFGNFTSNMISDPLTLEIGETNENIVEFGTRMGQFYALAYAFNGNIDEAGADNHMDNFGAQLGYILEQELFSVDLGVSYINNLVDSDGWGDEFEDGEHELHDYVGGMALHAVVEAGTFNFIGEYVCALDDPEYVLGGNVEERDAIAVWNLEAGYTFTILNKASFIALAYQGSNNSDSFMPAGYAAEDEELDFIPQHRYMLSMGMEIFPCTSLALEYLHDEYEDDDSADILSAQLALKF